MVILTILGVILLSAIVGGTWWLRRTKTLIDEATLCPQSGPRAVHLFVFDQTDPISPQQAELVRQRIARLLDKAQIGERFDLFTIEADTRNILQADLQVCSPGSGDDASEWYENPRRIRARFEELFVKPVREKVDNLLRESTRPSSPIVESLKAAAITSLARYERREIPVRITIVSDMIQHSAVFSHFRNSANFEELAVVPNWPAVRPNLKGASVEILYLVRPEARRAGKQIQDRGHQYFWERLIADSDGQLQSIDPL